VTPVSIIKNEEVMDWGSTARLYPPRNKVRNAYVREDESRKILFGRWGK